MVMARGVMLAIVPRPARAGTCPNRLHRQTLPSVADATARSCPRCNNGLHAIDEGGELVEDLTQQIRNDAQEGTVGRLIERVHAAFAPGQTIGETIEALRERVKNAIITYIYVVDAEGRLLGVVTMRDLVFCERDKTLGEVMLRDVFALRADRPLDEALER